MPSFRHAPIRTAMLAALCACGACAIDFDRYRPVADGATTDVTPRTDVADSQTVETLDVVVDVPPPDAVADVPPDNPCGAASQACCPSGANAGCAEGTLCVGGTCVACGDAMQACCGTSCHGSLACIAGMCRSDCGALGQACCAGSSCDGASAACIGGMCTQCGGVGDHCCTGGSCSTGSFCSNSPSTWMTGRCWECGHYGQFCCPTGTACAEGTCQATASGPDACLGAPTGTAGGYCPPSAAGLYCSDGSICTPDNFCESCGSFDEICCGGVDCNPGFACSRGICQ